MVQIVSQDNFSDSIASGLVLVDFFAEWCGPCKMLTPVLEAVATELPSVTVLKLDIDASPRPAEQYGVSSIPTLILFKDGREVERSVGLKDKDSLIRLISEHQ
ncbi:thioredoxin [Chlamydia sp.]|uniref:thioredoxin n=1 Tax=Chlamydia sp. TaxID=35827 RepID=UPI0025BB8945|nr:thioredoxin [Chlamydia sp.]MBQ8498967.1 thioredoxin [Chlamydia sp.]